MFTHEESTTLLDSTMDVLEGDLASKTPQSGTGILDQWLAELNKAENAKDISSTLEQLKTQLKSDQINTDELVQVLETLATQTAEFSTMMGSEGDIAPRLEGLAATLRSLAGQVGNQ
ncbi:hypothetical protein [Spirosoma pollinicola]|uniref:Uncharacterized protein n=1 Tax=Spirosoma pollinicola TaxID=2057025 RepID=A0A2K8Z0C7_9BACT|nr:hypothetical protein [Spirosoma pollinicola]AUD03350.1 hypothetical protein CWM47_16820 [Spirosoma pollinicola]